MHIKIDENVPARVAPVLQGMGHDVDTVADEGLTGADDEAIRRAARDAERLLITQDLDFSNVRDLQPGSRGGVLLLRLRCPGRNALLERVRHLFESESVEQWAGCIVVASERKIRVRRR